MDFSVDERIRTIWSQLEDETGEIAFVPRRKYKRLEIGKETGVRLSYYLPTGSCELLIEIGAEYESSDFSFPNWKGMTFDVIQLDLPAPDTYHICFRLEHPEHREVFLSVCSDLVRELQNVISVNERKIALIEFLGRWTRFFERHGLEGLSQERQRGLFGELWWLRRLLNKGIKNQIAIHSWKGCERGYHDFEINGQVIEVKTTLSKEPRKVVINNERQLDDRGLSSLHLLALSLIQSEHGGESLPDIVMSLRKIFSSDTSSSRRFEHDLREAGYLDNHAQLYNNTYTVKSEDLFKISEGFPRIVELPSGLGDLKYSLLLAACKAYQTDADDRIETMIKRESDE